VRRVSARWRYARDQARGHQPPPMPFRRFRSRWTARATTGEQCHRPRHAARRGASAGTVRSRTFTPFMAASLAGAEGVRLSAGRARHRDGPLDDRDHDLYRQRELRGCHVHARVTRGAQGRVIRSLACSGYPARQVRRGAGGSAGTPAQPGGTSLPGVDGEVAAPRSYSARSRTETRLRNSDSRSGAPASTAAVMSLASSSCASSRGNR
jgi:hypothetical protein